MQHLNRIKADGVKAQQQKASDEKNLNGVELARFTVFRSVLQEIFVKIKNKDPKHNSLLFDYNGIRTIARKDRKL